MNGKLNKISSGAYMKVKVFGAFSEEQRNLRKTH